MSTAIVWMHHPRGFVIGADGRRTDSGTVVSDAVQKIFGVRLPYLTLAYAWTGSINMTRTDGAVLDLKDATDAILTSPEVSSQSSFSGFLESFNRALHALLLISIGVGVKNLPKKEIARCVFLGYFRNHPFAAEIRVTHNGQIIQKPEITVPPFENRFDVFTGSERAYEEFRTKMRPAASVDEASAMIRDYIELCMKYQDS